MHCQFYKNKVAAAYRFCVAHDRGTVTAEFAIVLPAVVAVALVFVGVAGIVTKQLDCDDAARQAAYSIISQQYSKSSTQEMEMNARNIAKKVAGANTSVQVRWEPTSFEVKTTCTISSSIRLNLAPSVHGAAKGVRHDMEEE